VAGLADHVWSLEEIVQMADGLMAKSVKRGPSKRELRHGQQLTLEAV
jgi:hypothetical protein